MSYFSFFYLYGGKGTTSRPSNFLEFSLLTVSTGRRLQLRTIRYRERVALWF